MISRRTKYRIKAVARDSAAARRLRSTLRTYPALDSAARRLVGNRRRLRSIAKQVGTGERTPNEVTNALVLDLIKRRRLDEALVVIQTFLSKEPNAARSRFIEGIVHLCNTDFSAARASIDGAYRQAWAIRDDLAQIPNWHALINEAAEVEPNWAWPEYIRLKSLERMPATAPETLLALIDTREAPVVVEFSVKFGRPHHSTAPPLRRRMRVTVFESTSSSLQLQRLRLNHLPDSTVVHVPALASAAERPGGWLSGTAAALLAEAGVERIDKLHIDAEFASADILVDLLDAGMSPRVLTVSLFRMTIDQRVAVMCAVSEAGMHYQAEADQLVAVEHQLVADRRVHAWWASDADFDQQLLDDYVTEPPCDLAKAIQQTFIDNQIRFFVSPTDNPRVTRFSLGNVDKGFALNRILEIDTSPAKLHIPSLNTIVTRSPLVRLHLVDDQRHYLARTVELDFWTDRGDYVRSGNLNKFTNWIPKTRIERSMFAYNPPFLADDPDPPVTLERRLGVRSTVHYHPEFPVDIVFTWVDDSDPRWRQKRADRQRQEQRGSALALPDSTATRYRNRDELRYALRSIRAFMPEARRIFLVTDDQVPNWLDPDSSDITVVDHTAIFENPDDLPCFNSNAIETQLKNIPELAEHFVYFNDDVMLLGPTSPLAFFHANGLSKSFLEHERSQYGEPHEDYHNSKNAVLNASIAFEQHFGRTFHQYHEHTPFPLRRSVLERMATEFDEELRQTASHHFRSLHDIAPVSSLYQWYSFEVGASVPGALRSRYINLGSGDALDQLDLLEIGTGAGVLCLNDAPNDEIPEETIDAALATTLERLFPVAAPWEGRTS